MLFVMVSNLHSKVSLYVLAERMCQSSSRTASSPARARSLPTPTATPPTWRSCCVRIQLDFSDTLRAHGRIDSQQNAAGKVIHSYAKTLKVLEINPRSPLIEGLLKRVEQLPSEEDERDIESEDELKEVMSVLIDSALVRSGFDVHSANE